MSKAERFIHQAMFAKNAWLKATKLQYSWRLALYSQPRKSKICNATINLTHDLNCVSPFSFIAVAMDVARCQYLYVKDGSTERAYQKKDLYLAKERHFDKTSANAIFDKLIKRAFERDKAMQFGWVENDIENIKQLAEDVRKEIYVLFKYFTDQQLKSLSGQLLGTKKLYDSDAVKLYQLVKRITNYNSYIGDAVEIIENYEKHFEQKHSKYLGFRSWNTDGSISYKQVLEFINFTKFESEKLINTPQL